VWAPAHLAFDNGGEAVALIPTRYPGSEHADEGLIVMGRKTVWQEAGSDRHYGLGQRILATDAADVPLLELRSLTVNAPTAEAGV